MKLVEPIQSIRMIAAALLSGVVLAASAQTAPEPAPPADAKQAAVKKSEPKKTEPKKTEAKKTAAKTAAVPAKQPLKVYTTGPTTLRDKDGNVIPTNPEAYPVDSALPKKK